MDNTFKFHCEAWHCLNGHVWLDGVRITEVATPELQERTADQAHDLLVPRPWSVLNFPRSDVKNVVYDPLARESALFQILAAVDVTKEGIQQFADSYGMLYHNAFFAETHVDGRELKTSGVPFYVWRTNILSLRHWLKVWELCQSRDAKGLLEQANSLRERARKEGSFGDRCNPIQNLLSDSVGIIKAKPNERIAEAKKALRFGLWETELRTGLTMHLRYDDRHNSFGFFLRAEHLITAIWAQFATALTNEAEYRRCEVCGKPFQLSPDIARKSRHYCSTPCRLKAYRTRMREALKMHQRDKSLREIADRLNSNVKTVRGWIKAAKEKEK